jgi:mannan endo-1,4-beta-mannosidase
VQHLRDACQVHNLLFAFSLNDGFTNTQFTNFYPGNSWVDIIGLDAYQRPGTSSATYINNMKTQIDKLIVLCNDRNKLPAVTEMGCNNLASVNGQVYDSWFTQVMYECIKKKQIAYCMLWRNPKGAALGDGTEFYCTFPNHSTVTDFNIFFQKIEILFSKTTGNKKLFI